MDGVALKEERPNASGSRLKLLFLRQLSDIDWRMPAADDDLNTAGVKKV